MTVLVLRSTQIYGNTNEDVAATFASLSVQFRLLGSSEDKLWEALWRNYRLRAMERRLGVNYACAANEGSLPLRLASSRKRETEEVFLAA